MATRRAAPGAEEARNGAPPNKHQSSRSKAAASKMAAPPAPAADDELDQVLKIRVKERDPDALPGGGQRPNKRLGTLFRDPSPAIESIKRPLTGLFRRPASRAGQQQQAKHSRQQPLESVFAAAAADDELVEKDQLPPKNRSRQVSIDEGELDRLAGADANVATAVAKPNAPKGFLTASSTLNRSDVTELTLDGQVAKGRRGGSGPRVDRQPSPDIPQLEEAPVAELGDQIALAPNVRVNQVASYKELDNALMKHAAFSTLEDIDLSLLTRFLCPESEVKDEEVAWTWDYLYTSICTELREDWLLEEEEETAAGGVGGGKADSDVGDKEQTAQQPAAAKGQQQPQSTLNRTTPNNH